MRAIRIRRDDDADEVARLDGLCFSPAEAYPVDLSDDPECWLAYDGEHAVAFGVAVRRREGVFLRRCGVLPAYRGQGLQRRLIRVRLAWARREGAASVATYTRADNAESMRALIATGFRPVRESWAGDGFVHWRRAL